MSDYRRLSRQERSQIEALLRQEKSVRFIARVLGRSPSSISREIRRNKVVALPNTSLGPGFEYESAHAEKRAGIRKASKRPRRQVIEGGLERFILRKLQRDWSPQQITERLKRVRSEQKVSHPTIYRYIYKNALHGGDLYLHLRTRRRRRTKKANRKPYSSVNCLPKLSIKHRPNIVQKRKRLGDYERDMVHGSGHNQSEAVIFCMVDRKSRLTRLRYLPKKTAKDTHRATVDLLRGMVVKSITNDNGSEFADHGQTAQAIKVKVYFCRPGHFWERGTNENTNGLLRQYFPKGMDFKTITPEQVRKVERLLNHRPRKCLGYKTPYEVHAKGRS